MLQKIIIDLGLKIRITCVNNNIVCFTSVICSSLYYNNFKTLRFYNGQFLYLLLCLFHDRTLYITIISIITLEKFEWETMGKLSHRNSFLNER